MVNQLTVQATNMQTISTQSRHGYTMLMIRALNTLVSQKEYTTVSTSAKAYVWHYESI